jgi:DNA-binding MarR family transcriptional regulator
MSRHITDLGEQNRYRTSGYELVEQKIDPNDRRYRRAYLTAKGVTFRNKLVRHLER